MEIEDKSEDFVGKEESFEVQEEKEDSCEQVAMTRKSCDGWKGLNPGYLWDQGRGPAPA
jgi:hypothetical protein